MAHTHAFCYSQTKLEDAIARILRAAAEATGKGVAADTRGADVLDIGAEYGECEESDDDLHTTSNRCYNRASSTQGSTDGKTRQNATGAPLPLLSSSWIEASPSHGQENRQDAQSGGKPRAKKVDGFATQGIGPLGVFGSLGKSWGGTAADGTAAPRPLGSARLSSGQVATQVCGCTHVF